MLWLLGIILWMTIGVTVAIWWVTSEDDFLLKDIIILVFAGEMGPVMIIFWIVTTMEKSIEQSGDKVLFKKRKSKEGELLHP